MHRYLPLTLLLAIPLAGLAEDAQLPRGPLQLTLKRAVEVALSPEGNTYIQLSDESVRQAKSRSAQARSAFLPDVEAQAAQTTAMRSLAAMGLDLTATNTLLGAAKNPPPCTASELICSVLNSAEGPLLADIAANIPRVVGPFNSVDVRTKLTQNVLDVSTIRRYQASRAALRATTQDRSNTEDADQKIALGHNGPCFKRDLPDQAGDFGRERDALHGAHAPDGPECFLPGLFAHDKRRNRFRRRRHGFCRSDHRFDLETFHGPQSAQHGEDKECG